MGLSRRQIRDGDLIDANELASDGANATVAAFLTGSVTSSTASTKTVAVPLDSHSLGLLSPDHPVKAGDLAILAGTSAADGTYTVATVPTQTSFTTVEAIANSVGGTVTFRHPAGSTNVGIDPTGFGSSTAVTLQAALAALDARLYLRTSPNGPVGTQYDVTVARTNGLISSVTWTNHATSKIFKLIAITRSSNLISLVVVTVYKPDGTTVLVQNTITPTRTNNQISSWTSVENT